MTGDRAHHQGHVAHGTGERTDVRDQLVTPGGRVHRHAAEGRLQTDEPAEAGGDADRAGSVRAEGQRP